MTMESEKDPVCGSLVDGKDSNRKGLTSVYEGRLFYFHDPKCKQEFDQNPQSFSERAA